MLLLLLLVVAATARSHHRPAEAFSKSRLETFLGDHPAVDEAQVVQEGVVDTLREAIAVVAAETHEEAGLESPVDTPLVGGQQPVEAVEAVASVEAVAPVEVVAPVASVEAVAPVEPVKAVAPVETAIDQPGPLSVEGVEAQPETPKELEADAHNALMAHAFDLLTKIDLAIVRKTGHAGAAKSLVNILEELAQIVSE